MKITNSILKVAALVLSAAALVCLVVANLELISDALSELWETIQEKKDGICQRCRGAEYDFEDEFEDWDV